MNHQLFDRKLADEASPLTPLNMTDMSMVGGGDVSAEWGVSTGVAATLTVGAATVAAPVVAGAMAVGGVIAAGMAVYFAARDADMFIGG